MDKYYFEENEKDNNKLSNLNYNFDKDLHEVLLSKNTDSDKVNLIEELLLEKLKSQNKLTPYNLYKNGVLIEGQNNYK